MGVSTGTIGKAPPFRQECVTPIPTVPEAQLPPIIYFKAVSQLISSF
jgi:hypothetical protein